jgi:predicted ribosome quality control (RQC) complex YloA/Tae2 family protein
VHNNYYFLKQLSRALEPRLSGSVISECFSQNKNELILRFETHTRPFFVRANLDPSFSCLSFPEDFHRARKNSVDLFQEIIGRRVLSTLQFRNERSFALILSEGFALVFKMHGSRSNILIFKDQNVNALFRNNLEPDLQITLESLHREIDFGYQAFVQHLDDLPKLYFTFGQTIWKYLENSDFSKKTIDEKWQSVQNLLSTLNTPHFYIIEHPLNHILFSLVDLGKRISDFKEPIQAINEFFYHKIQTQTFLVEKEKLLSALRSTLQSGQSYLEKTELKLHKIENENPFKKWADLLMANMHSIQLLL